MAAFLVMLYHYATDHTFPSFHFAVFRKGYLCVDLFFVLSGFVLALSYGGRTDILCAARRLASRVERHELELDEIDEPTFSAALALGDVPDPDLFIRTGGEHRISNFLLWNLAYTELYFTEVLWPDFDVAAFAAALQHFAARQRRFGLSAEQIQAGDGQWD